MAASISSNLVGFVAIAGAVLISAGPAPADEERTPMREISVTGEGKATAVPDMATVRAGVTTQAKTAKEAVEQNNTAVQKILDAVKQRQIADKDVQTSVFTVNPVYDEDREKKEPEAIAYRVQNQVEVRVRDLKSLGELIDTLVKAGSNQISELGFEVSDPSKVLNKARRRAVEDAEMRAKVLAEAAGVRVGRVRQINEQPMDVPRPMHVRMESMAAASTVPIATGEQEYRATVNVIYHLRPANGDSEAEQ